MDLIGISRDDRGKLLLTTVICLAALHSGQCQFEGLQLLTSNSACTNDLNNPLTPDCNSSDFSIAIADLIAGSKLVSSGCSSVINETCCTLNSTTDCEITLDKILFSGVVQQCNGNQDCLPGAPNFINIGCPGGGASFLDPTNFAYATYYCIEKSRITGIGGSRVQASAFNMTLFIWNDMFPASGFTKSEQKYTITVETDVTHATLLLHTIQRDISADMSITVKNASDDVIVAWSEADNTYTLENLDTGTNYLTIDIWTNASSNTFLWWIGLEASNASTITINYPPVVSSSGDTDSSLAAYVIALICLSVLAFYAFLTVAIYCGCHPGSWWKRRASQVSPQLPARQTGPPYIDENYQMTTNSIDSGDVFETPRWNMALYDQHTAPRSEFLLPPVYNITRETADRDFEENTANRHNVLSVLDQEDEPNELGNTVPLPQNQSPTRPGSTTTSYTHITAAINQTEHEHAHFTENNREMGDTAEVDGYRDDSETVVPIPQVFTDAQVEDLTNMPNEETQVAPLHTLVSEVTVHQDGQIPQANSTEDAD